MQMMPSEITIQVARKVKEDIWLIREILEIIEQELKRAKWKFVLLYLTENQQDRQINAKAANINHTRICR